MHKALFASLLLTLLVAGCATPTKGPETALESGAPPAQDETSIQALIDEGDFDGASRSYLALAGNAASPEQRAEYLLAAAITSRDGGNYETAELIINSLQSEPQSIDQLVRAKLLQADIALWRLDAIGAKAILADLSRGATLNDAQISELLLLQARADYMTANYLDAARAYLDRDAFLVLEPNKQLSNRQALVNTLQQLSVSALGELQRIADVDLRGWMELARILKSTPPASKQRGDELLAWRGSYPDLPDPEQLIVQAEQDSIATTATIHSIAVLLPLSGNLAEPARAILEGVLAAHYQADPDKRPQIRVYDEGEAETDIWPIYNIALADGADVVIGPLHKAHVATLAASPAMEQPTLALNLLDNFPLPALDLYQYGLAPEDEAREAAERAWLDGHSRAVAVVPRGDWGKRVLEAFQERWVQLGGTLVSSARYNLSDNDYSSAIKSVLRLHASDQRKGEINRIIGGSLKFEPRRRQDVDAVFIGAFSRQARLFPSQLQFHYAGDLPIYATSHAFTGTVDERADADMNGLRFCDSLWILAPTEEMQTMQAELTRLWPSESQRYARLQAFGFDAFRVVRFLDWLHKNPAQRLHGYSGELHVDGERRVRRELDWARFRRGVPQLTQFAPLPAFSVMEFEINGLEPRSSTL